MSVAMMSKDMYKSMYMLGERFLGIWSDWQPWQIYHGRQT